MDRKDFSYRWTISVPVTIVQRLYARALGDGAADLIESSIPLIEDGLEQFKKDLPLMAFVPETYEWQ